MEEDLVEDTSSSKSRHDRFHQWARTGLAFARFLISLAMWSPFDDWRR